MAKVVITDQQVVAESMVMWGRTVALGAGIGLVFWILTVLIGRYVIEPLACGQIVNAVVCADPKPLAGNIATILVAVLGVVAMVRIAAARPIVVAIATAAILWQLGGWISGLFWLEAILWSVLLYAVTYGLFAWVTRHETLWVTIAISLGIVVLIRILLAL